MAKIDESWRKPMKAGESEIAFFCFFLFFGFGTFQRLTADSNGFFLLRRLARVRPARAREPVAQSAHRPCAPLRRDSSSTMPTLIPRRPPPARLMGKQYSIARILKKASEKCTFLASAVARRDFRVRHGRA
jgi:hypothetical protein